MIDDIREMQGKKDKKKAEPLSQRRLESITALAPWERSIGVRTLQAHQINKLHFDAAIKCAFAGFFRTKELTCETIDRVNNAYFLHAKLQRRDVTFADNFEHAIIYLRASKSDHERLCVEVLLAATGTTTCPIAASFFLVH
jgi:hypothetical protein